MRRVVVILLCFALLILALVLPNAAQEKSSAEPQLMGRVLPAPPTSGFRAEFLQEVTFYEQRYIQLAESIPAEKYSWRPAEGAHSVGEVFAHVAIENVLIWRALRGPLKPGVTYGFDSEAVAKNTLAVSNDRTKVVQELARSFVSLRTEVLLLNDEESDRPQQLFGRQTTLRGSLTMVTGRFGEHLGQLIAYGRMNGIVPPWTEDAERQQKPAGNPKP